MIARIQFVKLCKGNVQIIHPWVIFAVPDDDTMSRLFNKIKEGKKNIFSRISPLYLTLHEVGHDSHKFSFVSFRSVHTFFC